MHSRLNLRRRPVSKVVAGLLLISIAALAFFFGDGSAGSLVFAAVIFVTGIALTTRIDFLHIDRAAGYVTHRRGYLLPIRNTRYPISKIRTVNVAMQTTGHGDDRKTVYPVQLSGISNAVVSSSGDPMYARILAERLARRLAVPVRNRVYGASTHRTAAELDMPLVERWRRDRKRFDRPALPGDTRLEEIEGVEHYVLRIPAQHPELRYLAYFLLAIVLPLTYATFLGGEFATMFFGFLAFFALIGGTMLLALVADSTLTVSRSDLSFRQGRFPLRTRMRITEIEEMVVAADGITLIGDNSVLWIHWAGSKTDSAYLEAVVPYQLSRAGSSVAAG